ncbi:MFS general substrate transporter [Rickenella mellea]|uniref:MFS general substrate transporter n=1 Tax=Rickenella mellea TaxID=50990 RepID=A0A4Y7PXK3_9AGAM|nr:MFS general substrate transporter [Rickenella mellea]
MSATEQRIADEETPLLRSNDSNDNTVNGPVKETPLPWRQFGIVLFLQLAEPLTSQVIYPFLPQLIRDLGVTHGDDTKVGYYVGIMQSIFFATQALTVLHWSRASDRIGRKPVILLGLFGLSLSMYCFGLSKTFLGLAISRSMAGALNGNIGVIKSILAELTDNTNVARAFAYQPIAWSSGSTLGPLIGGALSHPAERFPSVFGDSEFMKSHPYFLPCAIPATFSLIAWIVTFFFLEETNPSPFSFRRPVKREKPRKPPTTQKNALDAPVADATTPSCSSSSTSLSLSPSPSIIQPTDQKEYEPVPLLSLLTPRVIVAAGNYALLSLVDIAYRAVQPVFWAMPISLGGLGLTPSTIGVILSILGCGNGIFQVFFFADIHNYLGSRTLYLIGMASAFPLFALFPLTSVLAENFGVGTVVWIAVGAQLGFTLLFNVCYGCIFIYITAASPNKRSLGATNGLAQMLVSITRCIGPAVANSLFSLSLEHGYLGGWLVYYVLILITAVAFAGGTMLPRKLWKRAEH